MRTTQMVILAVVMAFASGCLGRRAALVSLPDAPAAALLIRGVGVLDVEQGRVDQNRDVLIEHGRISSITSVGAAPVTAGVRRIDGRGATLIPGLIDLHGHLGNSSAPLWRTEFPDPDANMGSYLYCGVTTVLDPADFDSRAFSRRDRVQAGDRLGPTIFASGPMLTAPGGHPVAMIRAVAPWWIGWYLARRVARELADAEAGREAVAELDEWKADFVKVAVDRVPLDAPRLSNEVLAAVTDEARRRGLRVIAHIGTTEDALDAARAGVAAWMHGVYKERIPDEAIPQLAAFAIPMVVTVEVFSNYARLDEGPRRPTQLELETVPRDKLAEFDDFPRDDPRNVEFLPFLTMLRAQRIHWLDNIARLRSAGVTILAGSDTQPGVFPGPGLHRELHHLVDAGLTPAQAIRSATLDSARFLTRSDNPEFGIVAVGERADLVLVDGDPTQDISALSRIREVIRHGVVLQRTPVSQG